MRLTKKVKKNMLFVELWNGRTPMKMVGSFSQSGLYNFHGELEKQKMMEWSWAWAEERMGTKDTVACLQPEWEPSYRRLPPPPACLTLLPPTRLVVPMSPQHPHPQHRAAAAAAHDRLQAWWPCSWTCNASGTWGQGDVQQPLDVLPSHQIILDLGNTRLLEVNLSDSAVFMVPQKPGALNQTSDSLQYLHVKCLGNVCTLCGTQQFTKPF